VKLYTGRGEGSRAIAAYEHILDLWKNADTELQPAVRDVRGRIARVVGEQLTPFPCSAPLVVCLPKGRPA